MPLKKILITTGDPAGVGPEITVKSYAHFYNSKQIDVSHISVISDVRVMQQTIAKIYKTGRPERMITSLLNSVIDLANVDKRNYQPGKSDKSCGRAAIEYINMAVDMIKKTASHDGINRHDRLVTAPVSKDSIIQSGLKNFTGHTEHIARMTGTKQPAMLMIGLAGKYKVLLLTRHVPLHLVSAELTAVKCKNQILITVNALRGWFKIKTPRITVCNVNPHKGENGSLGMDEKLVLEPLVKILSGKKYCGILKITGPELAEQAFKNCDKVDLIACAYHDQAMLPLKLLCHGDIVNFTCGLPFIRTSPGHGTAFDIAGKYIADPTSMISAITCAYSI
jgi:4-hydroxythreonine-4-phosphate dehydrogenase